MGFRSPLDTDSENANAATETAAKLEEQAKKRAAKKAAAKKAATKKEDTTGDTDNTEVDEKSKTSDNEGDDPQEETEPTVQENQKSGQTSGNPEIQNSGNLESRKEEGETSPSFDYLGAVFGGITDPYEDFVKGSTQLPLCVWRALKASAAMEGTSVQQLLTDIVLGRKQPLPVLHPDIEKRFYDMAKQGQLRR